MCCEMILFTLSAVRLKLISYQSTLNTMVLGSDLGVQLGVHQRTMHKQVHKPCLHLNRVYTGIHFTSNSLCTSITPTIWQSLLQTR
jgi:hypothetical protein